MLSISMKHVFRVPFDAMFPIFTALEQALVEGQIDCIEYAHMWAELLSVTGWTDGEIEVEVDERWTAIRSARESYVC